ncbi:MAG: ribose-phosphate pyrophosphokinase [Planctomycetales bacterium]|nr:ribose-phosphate pyrophosphokinase [Planctomycetales bacterium]
MTQGLKVFSGRANLPLAQQICECLRQPLGRVQLGNHPDGENYCKIEEDVRGRDVFLLQPTCPPVNDNLLELLIMIDSCKRASANRITAVIPYFGYARQDRKDEGRVPITAKLVANVITRAGADRVVAMDLHAAQIQGFFDVPVDHLYAGPVLDRHFAALGLTGDEVVVVSPDEGSIKRAIGHNRRIGGKLAIVDKRRSSATQTAQENIIGGPVEGRVALVFDDMISTAGSICGAAQKVHDAGAREIHVAATHAVFCGDAIKRLHDAPISSVVVTDSIPLDNVDLPKLKVLSVAPLLAEAIRRIHHNQSISQMFRNG